VADKDVAGVRATIDAWLDAWTFGERPWSIEKFENLLDEDAMVIDDYGGKLSLLYGHKDYRSVWGGLVNATMRQWAIKAEEDSFQVWVDRDIAVASFVLRGGGLLTDGTKAKLRQYCTFPMERRDGRWIILKEHITTDPDQST
jgi:ketosteroid isomerase-like protein